MSTLKSKFISAPVNGPTVEPLVIQTNNLDRVTVDSSGNVGVGLVPAGTSLLELRAGSSSVAPLKFNAGTNRTSPVAGGIEYDGAVFYATPQGTQRGVIPGAQFFRLNASLAGANVTTAQNVLGVGVTLSASTVYQFEAVYALSKSAGTTSHTIGLGFGGTATVNNVSYTILEKANGTGFATINYTGDVATLFLSSVANTATTTALTSPTVFMVYSIRGTVSINAGGTFIPQYTLSAAPGGAYTTAAGSYFLIYPIGAAGANTSVGTWA